VKVCFRFGVFRRGLMVVFILSLVVFTGFVAGLFLASQLILSLALGVYGLVLLFILLLVLGFLSSSVLFASAYSMFLYRDPVYFTERGLVICG